MAERIFVNCKDCDGHKNVKFVMKEDDHIWREGICPGNYEKIAVVDDVKKKKFVYNKKQFQVFSDWSVSLIKEKA